ncbi:uncharacterized protein A1O9_05717 [Exophiala aquamarina CBS 119918]|uniref:CHAT domain-containing protein n=1 Tax=Exophiala aquamarina CBS 119918 TaxID=1182545 RepID=A0A072PDI3_9EURO|nr:uncharacterized protein A1O9_05717 [Exophiala aquamarina CBS 119918]KEF57797.1 hypothetical protein A1O9_05717 [Exophiala aquamarina CBS 119918]
MAKALKVINLLVQLSIRLQEFGSGPDMDAAQSNNFMGLPSQEAIRESKRTRSVMTAFNAIDLIEMVRTRTITDWVSQDRGISRSYLEITRKIQTWEHRRHMQQELNTAERQILDLLNSEVEDLVKTEGMLEAEISFQADAQPSRSLNTFLTSIQEGDLVIYTSVSDDGLAVFALDMDGIKHVSRNADASAPQINMRVADHLDSIAWSKGQNLSQRTRGLGETLASWLIDPILNYLERQILVTTLIHLNLNHYRRLPRVTSSTGRFCTVVAKPGSTREARKPDGEPELRMAGIEAAMISHLYQTKALRAANMSRDDFRDHLSSSAIFHIVTHGHLNADHPLRSCISLKEKGRILGVTGIDAKPMLAVFSVCLTGLGEASDSGDMLEFSIHFLRQEQRVSLVRCGMQMMWAAMIHMDLFHQEILSATISTVGNCWQRATKALYNMPLDKVIVLLSGWIELWDKVQKELGY